MAEWVEVAVLCRSHFTYAQEPLAILWPGGGREEVEEVLECWLAPGARCFRVRTERQTLQLSYYEHSDRWEARALP
jgi:hypothetical protein